MSDHEEELSLFQENIDRVKTSIDRFMATGPYTPGAYYDEDLREGVVEIVKCARTPTALRSLVGSTLGGLRSSLEYLARAVVLANGTPKYPKRIQFPIFDGSDGYVRDALGKRGYIAEASAAAQAAFEELQPYNGGNPADHPLWILHELASKHRHQEPILTGSVAFNSHGMIEVTGALFRTVLFRAGPFKDGTVLARVQVDLPPGSREKPPMHMKQKFFVAIAFAEEGPGRGRPVMELTKEIRDHIRDVVFPKFRRFL